MTFNDFYQQAKNEPTAAQKFIAEIAELTNRSEITVRKWLSGENVPDDETKKLLAEHFNVKPQELFPPSRKRKNKKSSIRKRKNKKSYIRKRKGGKR